MASTARWRASAEKSWARSAPSTQKATFGGAPVYVHMPSATRPTVLIVATTANCTHQLGLASSHFPRLRRIRDPLARRFTLAPMRFLLASHPRVAAPAV